MTTILIGISVGLGALVVLLLALLVVRWRSDNSTDERVAEVVASLNARMDELGRELAGALERAEEEGRRSRIFGELAGSIDLDDFKEVNDRIGHLAGDTVLAEAAERVRDVVRTADIACRVGGDEFAVILPESSLEDADQLYRRIQNSISSRPLGQGGKLFLSAGVAELRAEDDPMAFFQRADDALYGAKEAGKGRVMSANSPRLGPA